jgi:hypothetical protein
MKKTGIQNYKRSKCKLNSNNMIVTRADKGNIVVITPNLEYNKEIDKFIHVNNFQKIGMDPTKLYNKQVYDVTKKSNNTINELQKWQLRNLNPVSPRVKAYIMLHKKTVPSDP